MRSVAVNVVVSLVWLAVAPGMIAGYLPWAITRWQAQPPFLGTEATRWLGVPLILLGLPVLLAAFARFVLQGHGTAAPVLPPERLVVVGFYRYVRNPMYVALVAILVGQALLLADARLLLLAAVVWLVFEAFVLSYEEPRLRRLFGAGYQDYCAGVPRWVPRLRPWQAPAKGAE